MMAIQIVLILQVLIILCTPILSFYPVYGTKRYGGSLPQRVTSWPPYQMVRPQRYPINYYELYPYSPEEYYSQENYPVYYPRTSKYEVYQAVLPYYYDDRYLTHPSYYEDPYDEMLQETEREEREDLQPIGHELLYENEDNEENLDDVNAAFLQNLIKSQTYQQDYSDYLEDYGNWNEQPRSKSQMNQEDEDVRELKKLVKQKPKTNQVHWFQKSNFRNENENKRSYDRKSRLTTNLPPVASSIAPKGQKEEILIRPATPVRHPFPNPVLEMMSKNNEWKRTPSVYDTIKHMLDMEKSLENKYGEHIKPQMKKRIISSEESLAHQLSVLKKAQ